MDTTAWLPYLLLLLGLLLGAALAWFRLRQNHLPQAAVEARYVLREWHEHAMQEADLLKDELHERREETTTLRVQMAELRKENAHLQERQVWQQGQFEQAQAQWQARFEALASRILEEKSERFTQRNAQQMAQLLQPLREHIQQFQQDIQQQHLEDARQQAALQEQLRHLRELNQQLSTGAESLAQALRGDNKVQGNWGEMQLETLLERAGLSKGLHFSAQQTLAYHGEEGRHVRPDFIVHLPEGRHVLIDAKVSLTAYERYQQSSEGPERALQLQQHLRSLREHCKGLSAKAYHTHQSLHTPDYVLLYVPIEGALIAALRHRPELFTEALDMNVVMVSNSTLLATLRTIAFMWKQDAQKRNAQEIAKQSGRLYDKFCAFVDDLLRIGKQLETAQTAYQDALNKLADGKRYGDTLVGRAERLRELGAANSKQLPEHLTDALPED